MRCLKARHISAYLDEELAETDRIRFESHVQGCARCATALEEMRSVKTAFRSSERYRAPLGFSSRVLAQAAALDRNKSPWFFPVLVKFAEAAVLIIVIVMGIIAGKTVTNGRSVQQATNIKSSFSLDLFEATPPGSLSGAYLAMTEAGK